MNPSKQTKRSVALIPALVLALLVGHAAMGDVLDTWTQRDSGTPARLTGLAAGKGLYVVVGQGVVVTSPDAVSWTQRDSGATNGLYDVAFGHNTFVIVGMSGTSLTSTDGVSWIPRTTGTTADLNSVYFVNGQFITVGNRATIATSPDGVNWTLRDSGISDTNSALGTLYTAAYGNGMYVVCGPSSVILKSTNTVDWTQQDIGTFVPCAAYGNGQFVILGFQDPRASTQVLTSTNAVTWTRQLDLPYWSHWQIVFARGYFVAIWGNGADIPAYINSSTDGTNWVVRCSGIGAHFANVRYVQSTLMAVGDGGAIFQTGSIVTVPDISEPPTSQTVIAGASATFSVFAYGPAPLFYQWFLNSTNLLSGATNSSLTLSNATWNQIGDYSVVVSNSYGCETSSSAVLTVVDPTDTDQDGIPNYWEILHGLNYNNPSDAATHPPSDALTYLQRYLFGLEPGKLDTDGDGLSDYDELFRYRTSPLKADTDDDGMSDDWEVAHGLNPRLNDTNDDLDGDGLSNLAEYTWNLTHTDQLLDPSRAFSLSNTNSDFEIVTGVATNRFYYDRNDRLVGAEYSRGLGIAYLYDGNANLTRQTALSRAAQTNVLPVLWRFLNGLTNGTAADDPYGDADGDGWSNYQEWRGGTDPLDPNSTANVMGLPGSNSASMAWPFAVSNFVVGVGQLDGFGAEDIVIGGDGDPGTNMNFLLVLTQTSTGWSTQRVDVGVFGITSIAVGQPTNRPNAAIYLGLRGTTNGSGRVMEFASNGGLWQSNVVALATNQAAFVLGVRGSDLLVSLGTTNGADGSLSSLSFSTNWTQWLADTNTSHRGLGIIASVETNQSGLRLLDSGGIQVFGGPFAVPLAPPTNAVFRSQDNTWVFVATDMARTWPEAQALARQYGGCLVTVTNSEKNSWLYNQFPAGVGFPGEMWLGLYKTNGSWRWDSGAPFSYSHWEGGSPPDGPYAFMRGSSDFWTARPEANNTEWAVVEVPNTNTSLQSFVVPEPLPFNSPTWRGRVLAAGVARPLPTKGTSVLYSMSDDKNANGWIDSGDDFVIAEYLVSGTNASLLTLARQPITALTPAQSYGLASANFLNQTNEVFFTGEPDGQVFAWTATGTTNPLQRQLLSGQHAGKAWHALAGVKTLEPGEGLVGLRVDRTNQNTCDVVYWPPQRELPQLPNVPQTSPISTILPDPALGNGLATNQVRLWDAEGNNSWLQVQFQAPGWTNWANVTIVGIDGRAYGAVAAVPAGATHQVVWNAGRYLGAGYTNNLLLRARASDVTLIGDWSAAVTYRVEISLGNPMATNDAAATLEDTLIDINVLANDSVQPPATAQIASVGQPAHGATATNLNGTIRYRQRRTGSAQMASSIRSPMARAG